MFWRSFRYSTTSCAWKVGEDYATPQHAHESLCPEARSIHASTHAMVHAHARANSKAATQM
eukprot:13185654-Alexandrium_andersonii.AAC.1